jgi:hypothetical protein
MNATLVYSCKPYRAAYEPSPATKLFNAILKEKFVRLKSTRITMKNNNYVYHPTDEYKSYLVRFRGLNK